MTRTIGLRERRARLAVRHRLLAGHASDDVATVSDDLVALHSSDPVSVYLSAMVRMETPSVGDVESALYVDRALVRHHAMRRTLWVATPDVVRLMHAAATRKLAAPQHRRTAQLLEANGIEDGDRWLREAKARVVAALHEHGPLTARALGELVPELRHPLEMAPGKSYGTTVSAHTRVLTQLGFEGALVRTRPVGSWVSSQYTWAAMDTWLPGGLGDLDEREAARDLADRWLRRFGPATSTDLQWWMGWTTATTKRALADCEAEPVHLETGDGPGATAAGWVAAGDGGEVDADEGWVALLPTLDPTVMGWKARDWYLPEACASTFDRNGNAGPTIWADGRVVGAWGQTAEGEVRTLLLVDVPDHTRAAIEERAAAMAKLLGDTRITVRFPPPIQQTLLGGAAAEP